MTIVRICVELDASSFSGNNELFFSCRYIPKFAWHVSKTDCLVLIVFTCSSDLPFEVQMVSVYYMVGCKPHTYNVLIGFWLIKWTFHAQINVFSNLLVSFPGFWLFFRFLLNNLRMLNLFNNLCKLTYNKPNDMKLNMNYTNLRIFRGFNSHVICCLICQKGLLLLSTFNIKLSKNLKTIFNLYLLCQQNYF